MLNLDQVIELLKKRQGERGQNEFAVELGVSPQYLNAVYKRRCDPGAAILSKIGLEKVISYRKAA